MALPSLRQAMTAHSQQLIVGNAGRGLWSPVRRRMWCSYAAKTALIIVEAPHPLLPSGAARKGNMSLKMTDLWDEINHMPDYLKEWQALCIECKTPITETEYEQYNGRCEACGGE